MELTASKSNLRARRFWKLTDDDLDRSAEQEAGDDRLGEEPRDPPHLEHRQHEKQHSRHQGHRTNQLWGLVVRPARLLSNTQGWAVR